MSFQHLFWAAAILAASAPSAAVEGPAGPSITLTPSRIEMGLFYGGSQVRIQGVAEAGVKVVVLVRGPDTVENFKRKTRAGPIWINSGNVSISGVPSLFLRFSSEPLGNFLGRETIERYQLDRTAIRRQMRIEPKAMDREVIRNDYLALSAEEGTYQTFPNAVRMGTPGTTGVPYQVEFAWPRKAPPNNYEVSVYAVRDGQVVGTTVAPLEVVKIGFPAALAALATEHGSFYGILAVLVAVTAGFGIDFLATRLRKKKPVPAALGRAAGRDEAKPVAH